MRGKERDALPHVVVYVEYVVYVGHPYVELQLIMQLVEKPLPVRRQHLGSPVSYAISDVDKIENRPLAYLITKLD